MRCRTLEISTEAAEIAAKGGFDIQTEKFGAAPEELRSPRITRVALFQNQIPLPTHAPVKEQRGALHALAEKAITAAAALKTNIFCFQETWSELSNIISKLYKAGSHNGVELTRFRRLS